MGLEGRPEPTDTFGGAWRLVLILALAGVGGCASLQRGPKPPPPVSVQALTPEFTQPGSGRFILELEVQNPVARLAQVSQVEWEIWLDGRFFAAGTEALDEELGPRARRPLRILLPVVIRRAPLSEPRDVTADIRGALHIQRAAFDRTLRFEHSFRWKRVRVPLPALGREED